MKRTRLRFGSLFAAFACTLVVAFMSPAIALGGGSGSGVSGGVITFDGETPASDNVLVGDDLKEENHHICTHKLFNDSSKELTVTVTVTNANGQPGYSPGPYGAPYDENTMHVTWKLGTQSSTDLKVDDTLTAVIPAGGYITLEIIGDGFVNVDPGNCDGCPSFNYQARLTAVEPVDVSDVQSWWWTDNGNSDTLTPSNLFYTNLDGTGWGHYWEVKTDYRKLNNSNVHVYDLVSLQAVPFWKHLLPPTDKDVDYVQLKLDDFYGKTLHLIATNRQLSHSELQALQAQMTSPDYYTLNVPSEAAFRQYLESNGLITGGSLTVSSYSTTCGTVSGTFTVKPEEANTSSTTYAVYVDGVKVKSGSTSSGISGQYFSKSGFNPSTSHSIKMVINRVVEGFPCSMTYTATQKTASFGKAKITPVKLSANKVSLGVTVPARECGKYLTKVRVYKGSKLIKSFTTTGKEKYIFTYSATGASKASYRVKAYWAKKASVNATSSYAKARSNSKSFSVSANPAKYAKYKHYFRLKSVSQSGSYVVVKGFFMNTHLYSAKIKCNFSLTVNGTTVAKKSLTSKKLRQNKVQYVTFKVKPKTMKDLYNNTSGGKWTVYEV